MYRLCYKVLLLEKTTAMTQEGQNFNLYRPSNEPGYGIQAEFGGSGLSSANQFLKLRYKGMKGIFMFYTGHTVWVIPCEIFQVFQSHLQAGHHFTKLVKPIVVTLQLLLVSSAMWGA